MARISGVNIPTNKKVHIALTYIFGIGTKIANDICGDAAIDITKQLFKKSLLHFLGVTNFRENHKNLRDPT